MTQNVEQVQMEDVFLQVRASTNAASTQADGLQSFNSDGFTLGANLFENGTNAVMVLNTSLGHLDSSLNFLML